MEVGLAEDFPSELFPRVLEVAADLHQQEDEERRARAFTGLAQGFGSWVTRDRAVAHTGWSDALRRMARRPRPDFLHDLAGFTHAQVAAELGLPAGTVRWRYRVALARLRPLVAEVIW